MSSETALAVVFERIPQSLLSVFKEKTTTSLYYTILKKLIEESLPEGSTILQVLVVERASFYFAKVREIETKKEGFSTSVDYKFYVWEYNRNMEILRQLSIRNLPQQQAALLAKRTLSVIERIVKSPDEKDKVIRELKTEFAVEIPVGNSGIPIKSKVLA